MSVFLGGGIWREILRSCGFKRNQRLTVVKAVKTGCIQKLLWYGERDLSIELDSEF